MSHTAKILLLGSGELGREFVISAKRLGAYVVACDAYDDAPAMQLADAREVFSMLDGEKLREAAEKHRPDYIVPEIEAIRTSVLAELEDEGFTIVPSARAAQLTMNRDAIRDLAAHELGLVTSKYHYAKNLEEVKAAAQHTGFPCVIKPVMSSSGKGQSTVRDEAGLEAAWDYAHANMRGDRQRVIVEQFVDFDYEITLLTVRHRDGVTFCPPIGHRQERGDYQESWQPCAVSDDDLNDARDMADKVTAALGGAGIWGIEFFLGKDGVYFSELSPRPHDTGMVTLAGTQNLSEFELHARTILGLPIPEITLERAGVSAVILASRESKEAPRFSGLAKALEYPRSDVRLFGKPTTRPYRRMGVALTYDEPGANVDALRKKGREIADCITVD